MSEEIEKSDFKIQVKLKDKTVEYDLNKELLDYEIDDVFSIQEAMRQIPLQYSKYAKMCLSMKKLQYGLEQQYKFWHMEARGKAIENISATGKKGTLEDIENKLIELNKVEYETWQNKMGKVQEQIDTFDVAVKAICMKKDMILGIGQMSSRLLDMGALTVKTKKEF